jgi:uncharacterized lipoprotein YddW (UPF0748 family)
MKLISIKILLFIFLLPLINEAQQKRETRAVWITTNFKLDWPPNTTDEDEQKESLKNIFIDLQSKNFNTVYFQVRSNGTVMYNSEIEPFSPYITGEVGKLPSYDPLKYAIDLGKQYNLEVHAWVNMIRCFSGNDDRFLKHPKHVRNANPDWTVRVMDENGSLSYWLNPGYFQVQDYLVDILVEITGRYDVDGIHLDFFRYPDKNFDDDKYFTDYGFNISLADWRRNNITNILRKFKERAIPVNPFLKVGATPIGIRHNLEGARGWEGYSSVFQDTETWLKEELVDYLVPQIYWNFDKNPRFDILAKDWVTKSHNKNIVLGLAAYKSDVKLELNQMIEYSREIGAAGVAFFRYGNIKNNYSSFFKDLIFPANMEWKEPSKIITENSIRAGFSNISDDEILISWQDEQNYASNLYRNYVLLDEIKPLKLLMLNQDKVKLKFVNPSKLLYNYLISKINRLWNFSVISNSILVKVPYLNQLKKDAVLNSKPIFFKQNNSTAFIMITSVINQNVTIDIISKENLIKQKSANLNIGMNIISVEENLGIIRTVRITYGSDNKIEEIKFY